MMGSETMEPEVFAEEWAEEQELLVELQSMVSELQHAMELHQGSSREWRQRREEIAAFREQLRSFIARWGRGEQ